MCSNLSCYQLNTDCCLQRILYVSLTVTTRKKLTVNTQKKMRKKSQHNSKENHQNTREEKRKGIERNYKNSQKTINKMAISTHLSIITLNVNGLIHQSKDRQWLNG